MTAVNASNTVVAFDPYDFVKISYLEADVSKFNLLKQIGKDGVANYYICYDNNAFILSLDVPDSDLRGKHRFSSFGLKKTNKWNEKTRTFTDEWTGEWETSVVLINSFGKQQPITNIYEAATAQEKKCLAVLDGIRDAIMRDLVEFNELDSKVASAMVRPIYSVQNEKDGDNKPKKVKGSFVQDMRKSPILNIKCRSKFVTGYKFSKDKQINPEDRVFATELYKTTPEGGLYKPEEIEKAKGVGIFNIQFGKVPYAAGKWGTKPQLISAVYTPTVAKACSLNEKSYAARFAVQPQDEEEEYADC